MGQLLRAVRPFVVGTTHIGAGDIVDSDDPIVPGREALFEPVAQSVRTTATVARPVTSPPPFLPARPRGNASRADWAAYVRSLGGDPADLGRDDLTALADQLEDGD